MAEKIGVYICECGINIKTALDIDQLIAFSKTLDGVTLAKSFTTLCSNQGKEFLQKDIQENQLGRVVIAGCSPKEKEMVFRGVLQKAGLNPFLLQMVNIREQCAWVIKDKERATAKAKRMIRAAVRRVLHHEPLQAKEIDFQPDCLVVGAGIAGISAALALAQSKKKVYLVEKLPFIGGKVASYEKVSPTLECASCMLSPKLDEVLHQPSLELLTMACVEDVKGFCGNFLVKIKKLPRYVDVAACIGCSACVQACPVEVKNEYDDGLSKRKAIDFPYPEALPHVPVIDAKHCLRFQGKDCSLCQQACAFNAIAYGQKAEHQELKVGSVVLATGFDTFDLRQAPQFGHKSVKGVLTALEFERILNTSGPTQGKIFSPGGKAPKKIALVHCVGSRSKVYQEYCSGICCAYLLKFSHLTRQLLPEATITHFYKDFCLPDKEGQGFLNACIEKDHIQVRRVSNMDEIKIQQKRSEVLIRYQDSSKRKRKDLFDLVVLAPAVTANADAAAVAKMFDISQDKHGFFEEEHRVLEPVSSSLKGVFVCGCAQGPKNIEHSVSQGYAVAGLVLSKLYADQRITLEPLTAEIQENFCSNCKVCIGACPYRAIIFDDEKRKVVIQEALCRGCGICAAACPSAAIKAKHFSDKEIREEIKGLLE